MDYRYLKARAKAYMLLPESPSYVIDMLDDFMTEIERLEDVLIDRSETIDRLNATVEELEYAILS